MSQCDGLVMTSRAGGAETRHITCRQDGVTRGLGPQPGSEKLHLLIWLLCSYSPGLAGGQRRRRLTETGPLSANCPKSLWERAVSHTVLNGTGPVNIWCLLWMAWSEAFVVINNLTNRAQQKKNSLTHYLSKNIAFPQSHPAEQPFTNDFILKPISFSSVEPEMKVPGSELIYVSS